MNVTHHDTAMFSNSP